MLNLTCPKCGASYTAYPYHLKLGQKQTCPDCAEAYRLERLRAHGPRAAILVRCAVCGKEFRKAPSSFKSSLDAPVYCSLACCTEGRKRGLTKSIKRVPTNLTPEGRAVLVASAKHAVAVRVANGYRHSDETRAKLSKGTAQYLASHEMPSVSKIELTVRAELKALGIMFEPQHFVRDAKTGQYSACVDIFLPDHNIALEVNGTYWHADPRVYDHANLNSMQLAAQTRYRHKIEILHSLDIELREIWELDIRRNPTQAVQNVLHDLIQPSSFQP